MTKTDMILDEIFAQSYDSLLLDYLINYLDAIGEFDNILDDFCKENEIKIDDNF